MSLTLSVDGERWRGHLRRFAQATPGLVPVAKGNGYGFTLGRLARKAQWLADRVSAATPWRWAPTRSCPRSRAAMPATCWCSRRGGPSTPRPTPRSLPGWSTR